MSVDVRIPPPLRRLTGGRGRVQVEARTVEELLDALEAAHAGLGAKLRDETGAVRRYISIYVGDQDIRFIGGLAAPLRDGDAVSIVPAIAGG